MDTATAMNRVRAFKRALQARNIRVEKLLVFGSYATNTAKEGSAEWRRGASPIIQFAARGVAA